MCVLFVFIYCCFCVCRIRAFRSFRSADVQVLSAIRNRANGLADRIQRTHHERTNERRTVKRYKSSSVAKLRSVVLERSSRQEKSLISVKFLDIFAHIKVKQRIANFATR